jgi:hypothetical protein
MYMFVHSPGFWHNTCEKGRELFFLDQWRLQIVLGARRLDEIVQGDQRKEYCALWQDTSYREPFIQQSTTENLTPLKKEEGKSR